MKYLLKYINLPANLMYVYPVWIQLYSTSHYAFQFWIDYILFGVKVISILYKLYEKPFKL